MGPLSLSAQWTMERVIGYLGSLLRQPSNTFRNLAAQSRRLAYVNAMVAMWPTFQEEQKDPRGSEDIGDGYLLLGPKDTTLYRLSDAEWGALNDFASGSPHQQTSRSLFHFPALFSDLFFIHSLFHLSILFTFFRAFINLAPD